AAPSVAVETLAHFLAGLEERHALAVDRDMGAGARIAAGARRTMLDREGTKAAQLHPVAARERVHDFAEDRVDDVLDVALGEVWVLPGDALNEFGLDHCQCRPESTNGLLAPGLSVAKPAECSITGGRVPKGQ